MSTELALTDDFSLPKGELPMEAEVAVLPEHYLKMGGIQTLMERLGREAVDRGYTAGFILRGTDRALVLKMKKVGDAAAWNIPWTCQ